MAKIEIVKFICDKCGKVKMDQIYDWAFGITVPNNQFRGLESRDLCDECYTSLKELKERHRKEIVEWF